VSQTHWKNPVRGTRIIEQIARDQNRNMGQVEIGSKGRCNSKSPQWGIARSFADEFFMEGKLKCRRQENKV